MTGARSTPTSASWPNRVEHWFTDLTREKIWRGAHGSIAKPGADTVAFVEARDKYPKPRERVRAADRILASARRFRRKTMN